MVRVLQDGTAFAGHRIERLLGVGGMGEVYLATPVEWGRTARVPRRLRALEARLVDERPDAHGALGRDDRLRLARAAASGGGRPTHRRVRTRLRAPQGAHRR